MESYWKAEGLPLPRILKHKTFVDIFKFIYKLWVNDFDTESFCKHQWTALMFFIFNLMHKKDKNKERECWTGKSISKDILIFESQAQHEKQFKTTHAGLYHFHRGKLT